MHSKWFLGILTFYAFVALPDTTNGGKRERFFDMSRCFAVRAAEDFTNATYSLVSGPHQAYQVHSPTAVVMRTLRLGEFHNLREEHSG